MSKPIIGIAGSTMVYPAGAFHVSERYCINLAYINAIINNGGIPMAIPIINDNDDLEKLISACDAIMLPGGEDVDPAYYGEDPHPKIGVIRPDMDAFIMKVLDHAYSKKMPVFGICRGHQIINISKGGSLYQDLSLYEKEFILHEQKYDRSYAVHKVNVCDNTLLKSIFGEDTVSVNTMHHQAVKKLGKGLIASAYAPDGIIEALESEDKTIFAVQWHPEELVRSQPIMNKLFKHLISMAAEFSSK